MDALIRSGKVSARRVRLKEACQNRADGGEQPGEASSSTEAALRAQVEAQARAELEADAQAVYAQERERGWADGYAESLSSARALALEELTQSRVQMQAQLATAVSALERAYEIELARLTSSAGELAWLAVCRVAGHCATTQSFVMGVVREVCEELRGESAATVSLHPRDIATLGDVVSRGELRIGGVRLRIEADDTLDLGGCVIDARSGVYDGGLETQLRRLHAVLTTSAAPE